MAFNLDNFKLDNDLEKNKHYICGYQSKILDIYNKNKGKNKQNPFVFLKRDTGVGGSKITILTGYKQLPYMYEVNDHLYELILNDIPVKFFMDIEYPVELGEELLYELLKEVDEIFFGATGTLLGEPIILSNFKLGKHIIKKGIEHSFHIYYPDSIYFLNCREHMKHFVHKILVSRLEEKYFFNGKSEKKCIIDTGVYTSNRSMRSYGQGKMQRVGEKLLLYYPTTELKTRYHKRGLLVNNEPQLNVIIQETTLCDWFGTFGKEDCIKFDILTETEEEMYLNGNNNQEEYKLPLKKINENLTIKNGSDYYDNIKNIKSTNGKNATMDMLCMLLKKYNKKYELVKHYLTPEEWENIGEYNIDTNELRNEYTVVSSCKRDGLICLGIKEDLCGQGHSSNHNYLVVSKYGVSCKCPSEKCKDFRKIIKKDIRSIKTNIYSFLLKVYRNIYDNVYDIIEIQKTHKITQKPDVVVNRDDGYLGSLEDYVVMENNILCYTKNSQKKDSQYYIIESSMGTGKSYSVCNFIKNNRDKLKKILVVSPRKSYGDSIWNRLNKQGFNFEHYEKTEDISRCKNVVIQLESIHKIRYDDFDLMIMDECESILNQFKSTTFKNSVNRTRNIEKYNYLMKTSKKVFLMDGLMMKRTFNHIKILSEDSYVYIKNRYIAGKLTFIQMNLKNQVDGITKKYNKTIINLSTKIMKHLEKGENIYGMICSKDLLEKTVEYINIVSKNKYKIKTYTSETKASEKKYDNVNEEWCKYNLVLSTATITVGIDFNKKGHFNNGILVLNPNTCGVRDCLQNIYRVRNYIDNNIYYYIDGNISQCPYTRDQIKYLIEENHKEIMKIKNSYLLPEDLEILINEMRVNKIDWLVDLETDNRIEEYLNKHYMKYVLEYYIEHEGYKHIPLPKEEEEKDTKSEKIDYHYDELPVLTPEQAEELKNFDKNKIENLTLIKFYYDNKIGIPDNKLFKRYINRPIFFKNDSILNPKYKIEDIYKLLSVDKTKDIKNKNLQDMIKLKTFINKTFEKEEDIYTVVKTFKRGAVDLPMLKRTCKNTSFKMSQETRGRDKNEHIWSISFEPILEKEENKDPYVEYCKTNTNQIDIDKEINLINSKKPLF
jgi:hypothetical protein